VRLSFRIDPKFRRNGHQDHLSDTGRSQKTHHESEWDGIFECESVSTLKVNVEAPRAERTSCAKKAKSGPGSFLVLKASRETLSCWTLWDQVLVATLRDGLDILGKGCDGLSEIQRMECQYSRSISHYYDSQSELGY
jgi:hypothetical protein